MMHKCKLSRSIVTKRWPRSSINVIMICLLMVYNDDSVIDQIQTYLAKAVSSFVSSKTFSNTLVDNHNLEALQHTGSQTGNKWSDQCLSARAMSHATHKFGNVALGTGRSRRQNYPGSKTLRSLNGPKLIGRVDAIRLLNLDAPSNILAGQPMRLRCNYETRGDKLQSLSWYKNGREFFRYQPFERRQPILVFNLTGINVDVARSRNNTVYLTNTTSETSGRYKCEVTANTFQEVNYETVINVEAVGSHAAKTVPVDRMILILIFGMTTLIHSICAINRATEDTFTEWTLFTIRKQDTDSN